MQNYNMDERMEKLLNKLSNSEKCFRIDDDVYQILSRREVNLILDYINYLKSVNNSKTKSC